MDGYSLCKNDFFYARNKNSVIFSGQKTVNVIKMSPAKSKRQTKKSGIDGLINGIPIRKVYVAPVTPQVNDRLPMHFVII